MKTPQKKGGYMRLYRNMLYSENLTPADLVIYSILADRCEIAERFGKLDEDGMITMSISEIAKMANVHRSTAVKSIDKLERMFLITTLRDPDHRKPLRVMAKDPEWASETLEFSEKHKLI